MSNEISTQEEEYRVTKVGSDGFVKLVSIYGTDADVCEAARLSYGKGTRKVSEDETLLRYLLRHQHGSPFEMVEAKFYVRLPIDVMRQVVRHRTLNINEYSTRYSEAIDSCATIQDGAWRLQSQSNKQGSSEAVVTEWPEGYRVHRLDLKSWVVQKWHESGNEWMDQTQPFSYEITPAQYLTFRETMIHEDTRTTYNERLKFGVAREVARKDLPLSNYTECYLKCDLRNWFHLLGLRLDSHAQKEVREFGAALAKYIRDAFPISYQAFVDYQLESIQLSRLDLLVIKRWMTRFDYCDEHDTDEVAINMALQALVDLFELTPEWLKPSCRERLECLSKMKLMGLIDA